MRMGLPTYIGLRPTIGPRLPIRPGGGGGGYGGGGSGSGGEGTTCSPDDQGSGGGFCLDGFMGSLPNGPQNSAPSSYSKNATLHPCTLDEYIPA